MSSPFVLIVPGLPMITQFQQIDTTKFVTILPNPSSISEICFSVVSGISIPDCGIALYFSFNGGSTWSILGTVTTSIPSGIFRTGWKTMGVSHLETVSIGISLESSAIPNPIDRELPIMKVAQDLYNFITSYGNSSGDKLIIPADIMDRWLDKTKKKLENDPQCFF
ncbi:hypothetical protein JH06_4596 [Blastocystis sp. subtype 4]|uniref:hypothetical protein n=1 Tax=Blastocystis sp. subtype 4 TaxID=944170 RepID=UPI0007116D6C|nr:hypothetical protein JH06_4596 [Blastocystis sp. subtype 4]KNB41877.1 hypothetical protein JH06_4596 [Blastocystis sp. subtype 4]|eukprot:XP_014525320.1 hypothetical protein JH06_4596 [Blastocystis sp. subtype 4]